jgi:PAS domain S-box-containing protein
MQFETLLNAAPVGMYLVDADFRLLQANPAAAPVFSSVPGDVVGRDFGQILHAMWEPERADEIVRIFRSTLETGEPYHVPEFADQRLDRGVTEYYDWRIERIVLPDGRYGVVCYFRDISDQVNARLAIARSEERYRTLFTSIDEGFCVLEVYFDGAGEPTDYRFIEMNPAFERHTGLVGAVGKRALEVVPDLEHRWITTYGRVASTGEPAHFVEHSPAMGRWFEVEAFRTGEPQQHRVALLFRDITARKAAEDALMRELIDHKRVQEISCRLIPTDDVQTLYSELIDAAIEITQADRGTIQLLDHDTGELHLLDAKGMSESVWARFARLSPDASTSCAVALRTGERVVVDYASDARVVGTDDARAHLEQGIRAAQSTPLMARSGRLVGILTTHWNEPRELTERAATLLDILARQAADLIERARTEEALREADRRKDEFIATLAHELRNPLAAIRTALSLLDRDSSEAAQAREMTAIIERQSSQLVRLIDDLLDVSRISRGKVTLERRRIDVVKVIGQVVVDSVGMCEKNGLTLSWTAPEQPIRVDADPVRLAQVVNNLVHNACKFTPRGGAIRVTVVPDDGDAIVRVADTGIGMGREQLTRIFEMFTQADESRNAAGGLGIGLSLAKSIIELHGGSITATSEGPGEGSEFIVRLRAAVSDVQGTAVSDGHGRHSEQPRRTGGERIVLADDNRDALRVVALMLRMHGHEVTTAEDGADALEKVRAQRPDVVLLDIGMPGMDGYEVARRIRQEPWGGDVLLVAITGWGQERDKQRAHDAGFDAHLTKPVDPAQLEELFAAGRSRTPATASQRHSA